MVLSSNISVQKTLYEVLSVSEDATYDEIRAAYRSAALNTHPDKAQTTPESSVPTSEQQEFFSVQQAWEILRHPTSRADYDKQLQSSRQNIEIIASEVIVGDMLIESTADTVELLYPCRCGDYFFITSCELSEMGIFVSGDGEVELQASDSVSASVVLGCGSCSLKIRNLFHNRYWASVVMSWVGSFALGGAVATIASCSGMFLPMLIACSLFFIELLFAILQVPFHMATNSFRGTSRHPLKIQPSHYYLRLLGIKEPYIVAGAYMISCLTLLAGYLGLVST